MRAGAAAVALAVALGVAAEPAAKAAVAGPDLLGFSDLYGSRGPLGLAFADAALRLRGKPVVMRGYMAPPLKAEAAFFVLTKEPVSLCPFCQSDADWPQDIVVIYPQDNGWRFHSAAERVRGFLENTEVFRIIVNALGLGREAPR